MEIYNVIEICEDDCGTFPVLKKSFLEHEFAKLYIDKNKINGYIEETILDGNFKNEKTCDKVCDFYTKVICNKI